MTTIPCPYCGNAVPLDHHDWRGTDEAMALVAAFVGPDGVDKAEVQALASRLAVVLEGANAAVGLMALAFMICTSIGQSKPPPGRSRDEYLGITVGAVAHMIDPRGIPK